MDHSRHQNIFMVPSGFSVTLVGAGGIGAITALTLAKMGVQTIAIWDNDKIAVENLATQLHRVSDVGTYKVDAVDVVLHEFSDEILVLPEPQRVDRDTQIRSTLIISAVDTIEARQEIWHALTNGSSYWDWYLDMRMAAQEYQHFLVSSADMSGIDRYAMKLMSLSETDVPEVPCTEKATFFCAMASAAHAGVVVADIVTGQAKPHRLVHYVRNDNIAKVSY